MAPDPFIASKTTAEAPQDTASGTAPVTAAEMAAQAANPRAARTNARSSGFASTMGHHSHTQPLFSEVVAWLLRTAVVALFLLTFVLQPFVIPSESMERTLLVGDFLLMNKQVYGPANSLARDLLPYQEVRRGEIVVFHFAQSPPRILIKRVVAVPGDRLRIEQGRLFVNGQRIAEPYATFEPMIGGSTGNDFPATVYSDPNVDPFWWRQLQALTHNGELVIPDKEFFVMGDNRNHSNDSRSWGLVRREQIIARPVVIYFSLDRAFNTDVQQVMDDRLGHDRELSARLMGFARWKRMFKVVH